MFAEWQTRMGITVINGLGDEDPLSFFLSGGTDLCVQKILSIRDPRCGCSKGFFPVPANPSEAGVLFFFRFFGVENLAMKDALAKSLMSTFFFQLRVPVPRQLRARTPSSLSPFISASRMCRSNATLYT